MSEFESDVNLAVVIPMISHTNIAMNLELAS